MLVGFRNVGILPGHLIKAENLLWYAKGKLRDYRFFGFYIGWFFVGFSYARKAR